VIRARSRRTSYRPGAAQQRDEADEGRLEGRRSVVAATSHGVAATKDHGGVVRPSQLIASVGRTSRWSRGEG